MDHINPPEGQPYHNAPFGKDPNAEHPQLATLIIAAGIKIFGDGPFGWRIGSIIFSLIALIALYALVRAAGGSGWLAAGARGDRIARQPAAGAAVASRRWTCTRWR